MKRKYIDILGIPIDDLDMQQAIDKALDLINQKDKFNYIFTPNAEICMQALKQPLLMQALNKSKMNIADGEGVIIASKILRSPLSTKVPGCELVYGILEQSKNLSVYLLGASAESVQEAASNIEKKYTNVKVVGYRNGFFNTKDTEIIIQDINESGADFIILGLGAPKQELFIYKNAHLFTKGTAIGAGGTIDLLSGYAKRAPEFFCKYKLEWLYRLLKQPKRFIRMLNIPLFFLICAKHALFRNKI